MNVTITLATTRRILAQLQHDKRTIALMVGVPSLLMILLRYVFDQPTVFDRLGPMLLGIFPLIVMFVVTSVTTLRERSSGTLECLMTTPLGKLDLLIGYALAFSVAALAAREPCSISGAEWADVSFPGFYGLLRRLGAELEIAS